MLVFAGIIATFIVACSIYALVGSPLHDSAFKGDKALAFKDLFETVVKGTLLPLFTTLLTTKVAYTVAKQLLNKFSD